MQRNTGRNTLWRAVALALSLPLAGGWSAAALAQQTPAASDDEEVRQLETVTVPARAVSIALRTPPRRCRST